MKKTKIIIPALGVMLLSTAASVTGTVAWFSMNNFVTANNMNIQAKAESGIVISNEAKSTWKDVAEASHKTAIAVYPTSTADASAWVHSSSNDADASTSNGTYTTLSITEDIQSGGAGSGAGYVEDDTPNYQGAEDKYYLKNSFFIKSSAEEIIKTIYITNVAASISGSSVSGELNKSLRVLVKSGTTAKVFAPISGATLTYTFNGATSVTAINSSAAEGHVPAASQSFLSAFTIPAYSAAPTQVDIYVYFEGEDANCKSTNIAATLDTLNVSVKFGLEQVADA